MIADAFRPAAAMTIAEANSADQVGGLLNHDKRLTRDQNRGPTHFRSARLQQIDDGLLNGGYAEESRTREGPRHYSAARA